jgi:predicted permease
MQALTKTAQALVRRRAYSGLMFALIVLATTATGATFAVVRATLWRELPYRDGNALVNVYTTEPVNRDSTQMMASSPMMLSRWREATRTLTSVEGYSPINVSVAGDGDPEALSGAQVSAGLFELLGTLPSVGRSFRRDEEIAASGVIAVSDGVARRRFGSPAAALGKTLIVDGDPRTVIGVMPPGFSLLFQGGDAWMPLDLTSEQQAKVGMRNIATYGRLRPGSSLDRARADLETIQRDLATVAPTAYAGTRVSLRPLREWLFGDRRPTMVVLIMAVGLVLVIAIVNVANLTLADALSRRTQTKTRVALGARASSLIGIRAREIVIIAALGFAVALPLCAAVLTILASVNPEPFLPLGGRWLDGAVATTALLTAIVVSFSGAIPAALLEARTQATGITGAIARTSSSRSDRRLQLILGAMQSAITVVLLSVAVLLGRDLVRLMSTPTGLIADGVVVVRMNVISRERSTVPLRAQYADELVRGVAGVPGVVDVSAIQSRFNLNETMQTAIDVDGLIAAPGQRLFSQIRHVMPNVFRVLGVRVLSGRGIDSTDRASTRPVAVVSASFATTYWPGESAVGKRVRRGTPGSPWLEVVGVVDDVMDAGLGVPLGPTMYVSYLQQNTATARVTLVVRARGVSSAIIDGIRRAIWAASPSQAINDITPLPTLMSRSATQPRFRASVVGVFGVSAVVLVLAGVYATTLFNVLSRRRELGIRAAIGASPASLTLLATRSSLQPVLVGGLAGTLLALPVARLTTDIIRSGMDPGDVLWSLGAVVALLTVAAGAALLPARAAAAVPPTEAIRGG